MSDKYSALTVVFDKDLSEEAVGHLEGCLKLIRGVIEVRPHLSSIEQDIAEDRAREKLRRQIMPILYPRFVPAPEG